MLRTHQKSGTKEDAGELAALLFVPMIKQNVTRTMANAISIMLGGRDHPN